MRWVAVAASVIAGVVVVALAVTPNATPTPADDDEYTGRWIIEGTDPRGVEYAGSLVIEAEEDAYSLRWIVTGSLRQGTADEEGDELVGEWVQSEGIETGLTGTARIRVDDDVLTSTVTVDGVPGEGLETGTAAR